MMGFVVFNPAHAQTPTQKSAAPVELGNFNGWTVYKLESDAGKSCYTVTQPAKSDPPGLRRDPAYLFITHRPKDKVRNEISFGLGYPLKPNTAGSLQIVGGEKFTLASNGEGAWMADTKQQDRSIAAMRKGKEAVVKATSKRGAVTTDRYALPGLPQAMDLIDKECPKQ